MMVELEARRSEAPHDLLGYLPVPHPVPYVVVFAVRTPERRWLFTEVAFEIGVFVDTSRGVDPTFRAVRVPLDYEKTLPLIGGFRPA